MTRKVTKRDGSETNLDFFPTPRWPVWRLLEDEQARVLLSAPPVHTDRTDRWLEPCAGDGAIVRAARKFQPFVSWDVVEIRRDEEQKLLSMRGDRWGVRYVEIADALQYMRGDVRTWYDGILTNPPFFLSMDLLDVALKTANAFVALLLRHNWLGGGRDAFARRHAPAGIFMLPNRVDFMDDGKADAVEHAWFVWRVDQATGYAERRTDSLHKVLAPTPLHVRKAESVWRTWGA